MFLSGTTCRTTALLAALAAALAQTPAQSDEAVIRITVNLVQVDAVVTDSKDKPVTDLKAEDFEIRQDGKVQKITNFSYITTRTAGGGTAPGIAPARRPSPVKGVPPPPPAVLKPADIRRTVALVVDDLGLSFESTVRIREALKKFVDQEMQPGDLVAIIRTGAGMGALQQFTADKRMLHAAIDRVKYNGLGRVGISNFAPLGSVYTGKVMTLSMEGQPDPKRLIGGGSMKLGAQITPGDYILQVTVTDKLASEKYRTATQWMDFEIQ